ncbi:MAG: UpxY family transcription antiterminator [Prevotella sp.]|nr:UpxY family transcription antiterminator [Prevotella sp.]
MDLVWFPMRVTYQREMKVKAALDKLEIESFLPMKTVLSEQGGHRHYETVPAVNNLIFVHSSREVVTRIKNEYEDLRALRYIMTRPLDGSRPQPIIIPPLEMENFIRVASHTDESVMHLDLSDVEGKTGRRVLITEGEFAGVEGYVIRIHQNKRVVVQLKELAAVAITFTPPVFLRYL